MLSGLEQYVPQRDKRELALKAKGQENIEEREKNFPIERIKKLLRKSPFGR
jgi:hypothetical protein